MNKIIIFCIFAWLIGINPAAEASECGAPLSAEVNYERASRVFVGQVTQIKIEHNSPGRKVFLNVSRTFKGAQANKAVIYTSFPHDMGLGFPFEEKERYLVFTYLAHDKDCTNLCVGTKLLSEASEDIHKLEQLSQ